MIKRTIRILIPALLLLSFCARAEDAVPFDPNRPVPMDPAVVTGKLENGLTYYIRSNKKPEARAELRLVVQAGSIQETENQRGLAHFLEHMAFNGTKNFEKQELVNYLESVGMGFGADLNAYTSFDETVYTLKLPTDQPETVEKGFQILEDWAHNITFDPNEVVKERPVVVEEWRIGRGAEARMRDQQWPILLKGSRYAERMPIGSKESIEHFDRDNLLQFYRDWYRPDLMAVIAVGDFDVSSIEKIIRKHFSEIANPKDSPKHQTYPVPPHAETLFAIASDPENPRTRVQIIYKSEARKTGTAGEAVRDLVEGLMFGMLNRRLMERTQEASPPYLYAISGSTRFVGPMEALILSAGVDESGIPRGLSAMLEEARRAEQHGFTEGELEREKADTLRQMSKQYENRDKTESAEFADALVQSFLYGDPAPSIDWLYELLQKRLPGVTLSELNSVAARGFEGKNRVVLVNLPQKEGVKPPTQEELTAILEKARNLDVKAYEENVPTEPLIQDLPKAGSLVAESTIPEVGLTEWTLNNGIRVLLKPTDFKSDEILFSASSPGGSSLVPDSDSVSANFADELTAVSGLSNFNRIQLDKMMAGKIADVTPYIRFYYEGLSGRSAPTDLEAALQLVYLEFTAPRMDETAISAFLDRQKAVLQNRSLQPEARFQDEFSRILSQDNIRTRPPTVELLRELNQVRAYKIYQERFADASDFTFTFVGSFEIEKIKPLILRYLGSLPALHRQESWKDLKIHPPEGKVEKEFRFGKEPKSVVIQVFHGPFEWSTENRILMRVLTDYLNIRLREILREDMGGVYGVGVYGTDNRIPEQNYQIFIRFGCDPERVQELVQAVLSEIESLKTKGPAAEDLAKVKEILRRQHEEDMKDNRYWLAKIESAFRDQEDVRGILQFDQRVEKATPDVVQELARKYFDPDRYIKAVLKPEVPAP